MLARGGRKEYRPRGAGIEKGINHVYWDRKRGNVKGEPRMRMTRENGSSIDTGKWGRVSVTHKHGRALKDTGDPVTT